jgi:hypothetical protein
MHLVVRYHGTIDSFMSKHRRSIRFTRGSRTILIIRLLLGIDIDDASTETLELLV